MAFEAFLSKKYSSGCICLFSVLLLVCLTGRIQGHSILYSTTKDIRVGTWNANNKFVSSVLVRNFTEGPPIDFHYEKQKMCWADHANESINCIGFDGTETKDKVEIVTNGVISPVGLACDWFTNKLYWTDSETNSIEVVTMEGLYRKVLFWTDIDQPRAIALAPMKGLMFWTDWGEVPKIERAGMNGDPKTRQTIVSTTIFWPNGLTIDYESELIYWIDGNLFFIEVMTFEGTNRSIVAKEVSDYPFAVTFFHDTFYWTDWRTWSIHFRNKTSGEKKELYHHSDSVPMHIHVYAKQRQPKSHHPCENNNGGCSHLCLLSPNPPGYSCACPIGIKLITNLTCADGPQELLLLARRSDICIVYLDSPDYTHKILPLDNVKYSIAVDYDPVEDYIYWSDDVVKKIQRARLNGSDQEDVVTIEIQHPDGIAVDWIGRNIYWTDAGTNHVEVCRLNKRKYRRVIISDNLEDPRAIAVAPELGWLYWSDWNQRNTKIERSNLDGSERIVIVKENLGWPNGITLDLINLKLYWCDGKTDRIEYANMDGSDRRVLINDNVPHPFGFTIMGDFLYWTDWQKRSIERSHKITGGQREVILEQMANIMGLKAIKAGFVVGWNECKDNNGGCSQLCFYRHNRTRVCACKLGYELARDRRTCVKPETFLLYTKKNTIGVVGIENEDNEIVIPISGIGHASAIDYDINTMRIYWTDSSQRTIMRAFLNGSDPQKVVELGLASPEGIAVDWSGLNIYWTDPLAHRIEVARLGGSSRRTLLWEGKVYDPHSIVLDPPAGYMYWSEWGISNSIKKAAMDGSNLRKLISTKSRASDLTLDYERRRLYWAEIDTSAILSADLDGNDERVILKDNLYRPIGLTLYKDHIYWSEDSTGEIFKANKFDGSNKQKIHKLTLNVTDLLVYHTKPQGFNQCAISNGGCSHLCLALPPEVPEEQVNYTCACPTHYTLVNNECIPPKQFMIYSQKNLTFRLLPTPTGCLEAVLPIHNLNKIKAIDFDPLQNFLYWIEGKSQSIKRVEVNGTQVSSVVVQGSKELQPFDLAVDAIGRLLFWTCALQNVINITRLDNDIPFGILTQKENEKPRLIAIHQTKRLLFYTDVGPLRQLIRTRLDGSHRLVITKNADISAIAVDPEGDCIVWTQGHNIYMSNIEGENHHVLVNESHPRITQLTILSGWLYWIDRESSQLQRVELLSGKFSSPLSLQASHIVDIISVTNLDLNNSCWPVHQKRCSHFCILDGMNPVCACPKGNVLSKDKRTCSILTDCGPDRFTCSSTPTDEKDCIPLNWRCDKQSDCKDGSDELDCPDCRPDQFKCHDGLCINSSNVCDGVVNCADTSDEENCCKEGFQCLNSQMCLPLEFVCNKVDNCPDGSDEHPSVCHNSSKLRTHSEGTTVLIIVAIFLILIVFVAIFYCFVRRFKNNNEFHDQSEDSLSPMQPKPQINTPKIRKGIPDVVRMSMLTGSDTSSYDRNHITGASSSTNGSSSVCYPREPLNPPPSPATTAASTRGSSPSSRYKPYRYYKSITQPPPPTPCSTDVCDESEYNFPTRSRYDGGPFPPPPTPRSHCHSESCPPSPSSRSSTYFSPLPPPPSPVQSPSRGYDS